MQEEEKELRKEQAVAEVYPGLPERVKALIMDSVLIIVFMMLLTNIFSEFENLPLYTKKIAFVFIFVLYDPLFTSLFGGTLGHMRMNLTVRRIENTDKKIFFPLAILRYIIKFFLGWVSFLSIGSSEKNLTIHDKLSGSVVVYKE